MSRAALYVGDALEVLRTLPDESVQCCVTSPPYWGLRDYGTGRWEGGAGECDHTRLNPREDHSHGQYLGTRDRQAASIANASPQLQVCRRCGARRVDRQIGLERTPEEYVSTIVDVCREVRRVLSTNGTLWLVLGDSYAASPKGNPQSLSGGLTNQGRASQRANAMDRALNKLAGSNLKPKDLVGIPWRVAFALQADGWYLRSDIIWSKPNPMPESVTDRPSKAHEYVFLFSKSQRYFYDAGAVRETDAEEGRHQTAKRRDQRRRRKVAPVAGRGQSSKGIDGGEIKSTHEMRTNRNGRNARSVWTIATNPYPRAHFATFPPELAARCIKAGTKPSDTVLDPFGGSGTTASVATGLGRNAIHIDLNPKYLDLAIERIGPLLVDVVAA